MQLKAEVAFPASDSNELKRKESKGREVRQQLVHGAWSRGQGAATHHIVSSLEYDERGKFVASDRVVDRQKKVLGRYLDFSIWDMLRLFTSATPTKRMDCRLWPIDDKSCDVLKVD